MSVGVGVGDIINACLFIYNTCVKYKDAPKEFDEIAEKSKALAVILERINKEISLEGNIVERAGDQAYSQLYDILGALKRDSFTLKGLVGKYAKIHDEGIGRRAWFAIWESNDLNDLRRRIGWHEQRLAIWQSVVIWGSQRRLEGGQEEILKAINALSDIEPARMREIIRALEQGQTRPLERELRESGLHKKEIDTSIGAAVEYALADPVTKVRMSSYARSSEAKQDYMPADGPAGGFYEGEGLGPHAFVDPDYLNPFNVREHSKRDGRYPPPPGMGPSRVSTMRDEADFAQLLRNYSHHHGHGGDSGGGGGGRGGMSSPGIVLQRVGTDLNDRDKHSKSKSKSREHSKDKGKGRSSSKYKVRIDSDPEFADEWPSKNTYGAEEPIIELHRSKSTSGGRPGKHYREIKTTTTITRDNHGRSGGASSPNPKDSPKEQVLVVPPEAHRVRRSSDAPRRTPHSPLLVVPYRGPRDRPASYHGPENEREYRRSGSRSDDGEQIIVVEDSGRRSRRQQFEGRPTSTAGSDSGGRRDSSSHSFVRRRPSNGRDRSRDSGSGDGETRRIRIVRKLDRIDSAGLDER